MTVLLDTQCFVMAATERWADLPKRIQRLLADPDVNRSLSSISLTEVALKTVIGKLNMPRDLVHTAVLDLRLDIMPYTQRHAMQMFDLPLHHREPFDRMLIATAISENIPLMGGDVHFPAYKPQGLQVIWR